MGLEGGFMCVQTLVNHTRVKFNNDGMADQIAEEAGWVFTLALCDISVLHLQVKVWVEFVI